MSLFSLNYRVIFFYRLLFLPLFCLFFPLYIRRMLRRGGYASGFSQRLGFFPQLPLKQAGRPRLWIQAVSVGELQSIGTLIEGFLNAGFEIILTTTTSTGFALAKEQYAKQLLAVGLFPLDFWPCSALAWARINPDRVLHVDSELWPEHLHQAKCRQVPVDLCNARLSDRSFKRYSALRFIAGYLLNHIRILLTATEIDRERFLALGRSFSNTYTTGNLKLDQPLGSVLSVEGKDALLAELGFLSLEEQSSPLILLGSSTWEGEEALLLGVLRKAVEAGLSVRLLLVPRHPERRSSLRDLLKTSGFTYHLRSDASQAPSATMVYVADTMGELNRLTPLADVTFIGKSLSPHIGGQSPIAAAGFGVPMVMGPQMSNFRTLVQSLLAHGGALQMSNSESVAEALLLLLKNEQQRKALSDAAHAWYAQNQGATARTLSYLLTA